MESLIVRVFLRSRMHLVRVRASLRDGVAIVQLAVDYSVLRPRTFDSTGIGIEDSIGACAIVIARDKVIHVAVAI